MDLNEVDIDAIVRAVVERLAVAARAAESVEPRTAVAAIAPPPPAAPVAAPVTSPPSSPESAASARTAVLSDAVITLRSLAGLSSAVRQVSVLPKAVLTPSARDWFRNRGIEVVRASAVVSPGAGSPGAGSVGDGSVGDAKLGKLYLHSNLGPLRGNAWRAALVESNWEWESLVACPAPQAVAELAAVLGPPNRLALLVTRETHYAVCQANRHSTVRAAAAATVDEARDAYRQLRANLLVVDPSRAPDYALGRVLREFLRPGPRSAPTEPRGGS